MTTLAIPGVRVGSDADPRGPQFTVAIGSVLVAALIDAVFRPCLRRLDPTT